MSSLMFTQTKLSMVGKKGIAKPDADGYYELVVGGLNTFNNTGSWYYTMEGMRELFGPGSVFHRRVANGALRAEVNHPTRQAGESDESYIGRMLNIDLNNVCAHFQSVWLDEEFGKKHPEYNNPDLVAIMAKVKPSGPKGQFLKESLENPKENVCFSIRAVADEQLVRGRRVRVLKDVITIDLVNEGGILVASKWDSPATESIEETAVMLTERLLARVSKPTATVATESIEIATTLQKKYFPPVEAPVWGRWK